MKAIISLYLLKMVIILNKDILNGLFAPYEINKKSFFDFLDNKAKRTFLKHRLWFECSKATDESCINTKCKYNYLDMHDSELYIELMQEIQDEKLAIKNRT